MYILFKKLLLKLLYRFIACKKGYLFRKEEDNISVTKSPKAVLYFYSYYVLFPSLIKLSLKIYYDLVIF